MIGFLRANWLHIGIAIAIIGALWLADRRGYQRADLEAKAEKAEAERRAGELYAALDRQLDAKFAVLFKQLADEIDTIDREDRTIVQPIIARELARDPGLATRQCLNGELLNAVNIARGHPSRGKAEAR